MQTSRVRFDQVKIGEQFIGDYGERGELSAGFSKTSDNMGHALSGNWPMRFLHDEKVQVSVEEVLCPQTH